MLFNPLLALLLISLILSLCSAWLASSTATPLRFWSLHPWKVFWACLLLGILGLVLFALGMSWIGGLLLVCGYLPVFLSAIQGLRVTWHLSRKKAALVLAAGLAMGVVRALGTLASKGNWQQLDFDLFTTLIVVAWWALLAYVADRFAQRLAARSQRILEEAFRRIEETQRKLSRNQSDSDAAISGKTRWQEVFPNSPVGAEKLPWLARRQTSGHCGACHAITEWYDSQLQAWVCCADCGEELESRRLARNNTGVRVFTGKKIAEVALLCVLWIPIVLSGIENLREQLGYGWGTRWDSWSAILVGWGVWLAGCYVWYCIIGFVGTKIFGDAKKNANP